MINLRLPRFVHNISQIQLQQQNRDILSILQKKVQLRLARMVETLISF